MGGRKREEMLESEEREAVKQQSSGMDALEHDG